MLNNKGQSLILFVIVLPILLIILVLVVDMGRLMVLKQELDNINEIVLDYGLDNLDNNNLNNIDLNDSNNTSNDLNKNDDVNEDIYNNDSIGNDVLDNQDINNIIEFNDNGINNLESKLIDLVKLNKNDIDLINVRIENNKIYIELGDRLDGIFSSLIDISIFDVKSSYVGYMDDDNKRIERVNG